MARNLHDLTTEPNMLCAPLYDRMPVVLAPEEWPRWLGTIDDRKALLRPSPSERMECLPVGKDVGSGRIDRPQLVAQRD